MMKNKLSQVVNKALQGNAARNAAFVMAAFSVTSAAHAELPTWATSMFTEVSTSVSDVLTAVGPVIGAALVGFTIIKLIKRGASKI